jgi:hypothetical protein
MLLEATALAVAARYITPIIIRQIAMDGVYHADCTGHPGITEAAVTVSTNVQHLILSNESTIAIIALSDIQSAIYEITPDGSHSLKIVWRSYGLDVSTTLTLNTWWEAYRLELVLCKKNTAWVLAS